MSGNDTKFSGSIPALYDRYMGDIIFAPYAVDLADRLRDVTEGTVLEIAAGTGIATRALAETLPETVAIIATDLNQPMLDHAASKPGMARVTFRQANALRHRRHPGADAGSCRHRFGLILGTDGAAVTQARSRACWRWVSLPAQPILQLSCVAIRRLG
jgi:SAM-dependent methyltransferase